MPRFSIGTEGSMPQIGTFGNGVPVSPARSKQVFEAAARAGVHFDNVDGPTPGDAGMV